MVTHDTSGAGFEGLALHEQFPLVWEPSALDDPATLEHCGQDTARALQALALFEESPRELAVETTHPGHDLAHLEAKIDVLLSLVTRLVADRQGAPARHDAVIRPDSIEWAGPAADQVVAGDTGIITLYPHPLMPLAFRLPARVSAVVDRGGRRWILTELDQVPTPVRIGLEKLVFRRHRRQVALSRGTDVFSRTGVFSPATLRAPKS